MARRAAGCDMLGCYGPARNPARPRRQRPSYTTPRASRMTLTIIGRSSSHFTRTARMFAHECGLAYRFEPVLDLMSVTPADYGHSPALRVPVLATPDGPLFGALNICRELVRRAAQSVRVVWPEQSGARIAMNAQELVLQ